MSDMLVSVEQASEELGLHPKTVLRYIRDGRLAATRVGKSYRISRTKLDSFAGISRGKADDRFGTRATCIVEIPQVEVAHAERLATFLQSAALTGDAATPPLGLQTAFDPSAGLLKIILIGHPSDVARLLEMLQLQLRAAS